MKELGIDIETYSSNDLVTGGVYRYVEAPDFKVLLFAYCIDGGAVHCVDVEQGEQIPPEVLAALTDPEVTKTAFNAAFERICLTRFLGLDKPLPPEQWQCTMVRAARVGLPLSLGQCAEVLQLDEGKMKEGAALIRYFSLANKKGRHLPTDAPDKWETFKAYCTRDVVVEQAILQRVRRLDVPPFEDALYIADQEINDRGVAVDVQFVEAAARFDTDYKAELIEAVKRDTGIENPNSPAQIKEYLKKATGYVNIGLNRKNLDELEVLLKDWPLAHWLLQTRRELGKTSNKKYAAILNCVCDDGRVRGMFQYYGASRTGRWAGRLVQMQNLPQNHLSDIEQARDLVKRGDLEEFQLYYSNVTQVLSELIRTAFIAKPDHELQVCDFSAIEARVIAWLAGEEWVLDVFREGKDLYCAAASKMMGVPVEKGGVNGELRQKGKIATLALGYGGGVGALEAMGGSKMGLSKYEMTEIVRLWRAANPKIVRLWAIIEKAAITAISTKEAITIHRGIIVSYRWGMLMIRLPSGRALCYPRATLEKEFVEAYGGYKDAIEYEGTNQTTKKWEKVRTYGGKLTENVVQAIARDILGVVLLRAKDKGYNTVFHVHDEVVIEAPKGRPIEDFEALFSKPPKWAQGLPLKGEGFVTPYYLKA